MLLVGMAMLAGCSPTRHLPEGEYLLNRNRIEVVEADVDNTQLRNYIRQQPNRRIMGLFRFHLNVYQWAEKKPNSRFRQWMQANLGEAPVLFDPFMADNTRRQFELYLFNRGYFDHEVGHETDIRGRRINVTYTLKGNMPYTIRNITYSIRDEHLAGFVYNDTINSLLNAGHRYDTENLQKERQRLTRYLKDEGFFNFSRDFLFFQVDSTLTTNQVDIEVLITNPRPPASARIEENDLVPHKRYRINNIFIFPEYNRFLPDQHFSDTTLHSIGPEANGPVYRFLHDGPMQIRPRTIAGNILLEQGAFYSISQLEHTHNYLAGLRNFRFVNIQFIEGNQLDETPSDTLGLLDVRVELTRAPANVFTIEAEGLNSAGNLGIAGNLLIQNRNVFRGAEILNIRFKGAMEVSGESADSDVFQRLPFNTLEVGTEVSIDIPKLLSPIRMERLSRTARPQSTILVGVNYRQRPDYTRYILNLSYGYQWSPDNKRRHHFIPLEISSIKIFNDSILQSRIPDANPLILSRYKDHLIGGLKYTYTYSSQQIDRGADFIYFRGQFDSAGNLMSLLTRQFNGALNEDQSYTLFGIPFAQYLKAEADFRYYRVFDDRNTLVMRAMGGVGLPYGNIDVMPFIKSFYGGGANSIRAWSIYNLGPGSYGEADALRFDKYGDIKLEANIEYRFPVYRFWKGALFADAGNVWFLKENEQFPGGEFQLKQFYREIAVGLGMGARLDFNVFLVRLDAAFPLRNPAQPPGERWIQAWPGFNQWNFNLGIGYPF